MIRTPSTNRVNITVTSYQDQSGSGVPAAAGRPPRSSGGARPSGGPGARQPGGGSGPDSLWVLLGVVAFLALVGLFFLHRLQSSFEPMNEEEALASFQHAVAGAGTWAP